jgi:hypothetical protein
MFWKAIFFASLIGSCAFRQLKLFLPRSTPRLEFASRSGWGRRAGSKLGESPKHDPLMASKTQFERFTQGLTGAVVRLGFALLLCPALRAQTPANPPAASAGSTATSAPAPDAPEPGLPTGKKLMLKDGSFQLVREYEVDGERVRYFSIDQRDWEEIPASLVDWDATKKNAADEAARKAALIAKVHAAEVARHADAMDVDASIEIAPKVFLPPGDGLFEFDGKAIYPLTQAEADMKFSKTQMLKQVLIPVPIIPTRHTISLRGTRAKFRLKSTQTEFYMRTADGREPQLDLIRAKVKGDKRDLANLDELFKTQATTGKISIPIQRWEIAHGVYRFTLGESLEPGEYAMAEVVQGGATSLYFWDFGVDGNSAPPASTQPK